MIQKPLDLAEVTQFDMDPLCVDPPKREAKMYAPFIRSLLRAKTTAAAAALLGARTGADPATITDAEMLAGTSTSTRLVTPLLLKGYVARAAATASRPTTATVGYCMYDTTLNKPVWLKTAPSTWVDATGATV